jgi:hypothetical protein
LKVGDSDQPLSPEGTELNLPEGEHPAELAVLGGRKLVIASGRMPVATVAMYWGERRAAPPRPSVESLFKEAVSLFNAGRYREAEALAKEVLSREPAHEQTTILLAKIGRILVLGEK